MNVGRCSYYIKMISITLSIILFACSFSLAANLSNFSSSSSSNTILSEFEVSEIVYVTISDTVPNKTGIDRCMVHYIPHQGGTLDTTCDPWGTTSYDTAYASVSPTESLNFVFSFTVGSSAARSYQSGCVDSQTDGEFLAYIEYYDGSSWVEDSDAVIHTWTASPNDTCVSSEDQITIFDVTADQSGVTFSSRIYNNSCEDRKYTIHVYIDNIDITTIPILNTIVSKSNERIDDYSVAVDLNEGSHELELVLVSNSGSGPTVSEDFLVEEEIICPSSPTLISPIGTITTSTPVFEWNSVSEADTYLLQIQNLSNNQDVVYESNLITMTYQSTNSFPTGNYRWRVAAAKGNCSESWSEWKSFSVSNPRLESDCYLNRQILGAEEIFRSYFSIYNPNDEEMDVKIGLTFSGPETYHFPLWTVTIIPGNNTIAFSYAVPSIIVPGIYDVVWGLHNITQTPPAYDYISQSSYLTLLGPGYISGKVTSSKGNPISGIKIASFNCSTSQRSGESVTDSEGNYLLEVFPDDHIILTETFDTEYIPEYYDDVYSFLPGASHNLSTFVKVLEGQTTSNINFELEIGGKISGMVTDVLTGNPIKDIQLYAISNNINYSLAETDSNGEYNLSGLPPGSYYVRAVDEINNNYIEEWYNNKSEIQTANNVSVIEGKTTENINFSLSDDYADNDFDGTIDDQDNCPTVYNPEQIDSDENEIGDACEPSQIGISIDGNPDDWNNLPSVNVFTNYRAKINETLCGNDASIKRVMTAVDENYVYLLVETYSSEDPDPTIDPNNTIEMTFDYKDGQHHSAYTQSDNDLGCNIYNETFMGWTDNDLDGNEEDFIPDGYVLNWGSVFEMRMPRSSLDDAEYFYATFINIWDEDYHDEIWYPEPIGCDATTIAKDSDGDGYTDDQDAFPNDPNEWIDTDGDGEGDNADDDDDGDGMLDDWEQKIIDADPNDYINNIFDVLPNDDFDGDGLTNVDEVSSQTDPTDNDTDGDLFVDSEDPDPLNEPDYGTTIITHGYQMEFQNPDDGLIVDVPWAVSMAEAIGARAGRHTIFLFKDGEIELFKDESITDYEIYQNMSDVQNFENREIIIVFDWIEESHTTWIPTVIGFSEAAGDSLFANIIEGVLKQLWSIEALHFIGHSRGAVVNSECIQRLISAASLNALPDLPNANLDENIHMTTLDAHPVTDEIINEQVLIDLVNNFDDNPVKENQVVGWKNQITNHKVSYIDNYFQTECSPKGLSEISGAISNNNQYLGDIFLNSREHAVQQGYDDIIGCWLPISPLFCFSYHPFVHTWYHGTIDKHATYDCDTENCRNIDFFRDEWYYLNTGASFDSSRIGGDGYDFLLTNDNDLFNIDEDKTFFSNQTPKWFFNGDFYHYSNYLNDSTLPGWEFQGGGGEGFVDSEDGEEWLILNRNNAERKHNKFFIPSNVNTLKFRYKVEQLSNDEYFQVIMSEDTPPLWQTTITQSNEWKTVIVPINYYMGTVQTLTFKLENEFLLIDGEIYIDDIVLQTDSDFDGLPDTLDDYPYKADSDNDGLFDGDAGSEDLNANGVLDPGETDPLNPDTDGDGIFDGTERGLTESESEDTDLSAGYFIADADPTTKTDPADADSDEDGILDGNEDLNHDGKIDPTQGETDPTNPDSDGDGIYDGTEIGLTEPQNPDATDTEKGFFVADADPSSITDPNKSDSDGDGTPDGEEDLNGNGAVDEGETDPGVAVVLGDLDGNGTIDTADYYIFIGSFGKCEGQVGYNAECDYDGDGCITFVDYQTWYGYYLNQ